MSELGCVYDRYDKDTLAPLTKETARRLADLNIPSEWIAGKSVLDVGCNTGLASVLACHLGASNVSSFDVTPEFVVRTEAVKEVHGLPISVKVSNFFEYMTGAEQSDVVFCLEVIHWLVHQRPGCLPAAIEILARATKERLIIETPWSIAEPSISDQTGLTPADYSIEAILEECAKNFVTVEFRGFATYFKGQPRSRRVLIVCSKPYPHRNVLTKIPGFRGSVRSHPASTIAFADDGEDGVSCKQVARDSTLIRLDISSAEKLLGSLAGLSCIASPLKFITGRYIFEEQQDRFILTRWVGLPLSSIKVKRPLPSQQMIAAALVEVSIQIQQRTASLLPELVAQNLVLELSSARIQDGLSAIEATTGSHLVLPANSVRREVVTHSDLHSSNMVVALDGHLTFVDLDNLQLDSVYKDILWGGILMSVPAPFLIDACSALQKARGCRPVDQQDIAITLRNLCVWVHTVNRGNNMSDEIKSWLIAMTDTLLALSALVQR